MLIQTWRFPFVEHKIRCFAEFAKHYFLHTVQAVGTEAVCVRKKLKFESLLAENLPHICVSFIFKYVALTDKSGRTFCIASFVFRGWKKNHTGLEWKVMYFWFLVLYSNYLRIRCSWPLASLKGHNTRLLHYVSCYKAPLSTSTDVVRFEFSVQYTVEKNMFSANKSDQKVLQECYHSARIQALLEAKDGVNKVYSNSSK